MEAEISAVQAYQITGRIQAFTDDPTTRDVLSRLMDGGLLQPSEVMPGGVAEALEQIQFDADALIVDVSTSTDPVSDIADLVQRSGKQVVAIGNQNDVTLYRGVLAAGAVDYLVQSVTDELLVDALSRAPTHVGGEEAEPEGCRTTVITGVRGGIGASTVAVSAAWTLAEEFGLQTALVDLDLNFGTCALALDLLPGRGLREAIEHPERIDSLFVGSAMINATDRLFVLGGEEPLDRELYASSAAIHQLLAAIQPNFNAMIVDLPRSMITTQQDLLANAATIILVSDLSIVWLRDTLRLKTLMKENARQATLKIVAVEPANRKPPMTRKEFEKGIDGKIDILLPYDPKVTAAASNQGKAIPVLAGKRHPLVKALRGVANACGEARDAGQRQARRAWWRF